MSAALILEVAVGVALAPIVFALAALALRSTVNAIRDLPYFWEDHPNLSIVLICGAFVFVLKAMS